MDVKKDILWRVYAVFIALAVLCLAIIAQAVKVQQIDGAKWRKLSDSLQIRKENVIADRGTIYSEDGKMLSTSIPLFNVYVDFGAASLRAKNGKRFYQNLDSLSLGLSEIFQDKTPEEYAKILKYEYRSENRYFSLQKNISYHQYTSLKALPLVRLGRTVSGFIIETKSKRFNPYDQLAFRTIGLGRDSFKVGLELSYDSILKGKDGSRLVRYMGSGIAMPLEEGIEQEAEHGKDVVTTIDVFMQEVTETALLNKMVENNAKQGCAIVMETSTGKIKAIANLGWDEKLQRYLENKNYAMEATEPGSTFKLATVMALLEDGKASANTMVDLQGGYWNYAPLKIAVRDAEQHNTRLTTLQDAFERSSNVGMAKLALNAYGNNPNQFYNKLAQFRLDTITGIDLIGERLANIKRAGNKAWHKSSLLWNAFGYALAVNPLQTLNLYNAVANNGVMVKPYLVNKIKEEGVVLKTYQPTVVRDKVCSESTLKTLQAMLQGVCKSSHGTAYNLFKDNVFAVAGKTGTSIVAEPGYGYSRNIFQSSFAGYFPAENPQYSCIVVIINNQNSPQHLGAQVAGPVFKEIANKLYVNYVKNKEDNLRTAQYKQGISSTYSYANDLYFVSKKLNISYKNYAQPQHDFAMLSTAKEGNIISSVKQNSVTATMPNLIGMNVKDALYWCEQMGLYCEVQGRGKIVQQSIAAGAFVTKNSKLLITLN